MANIDQYEPGKYAVQDNDGVWRTYDDRDAAEQAYNALTGGVRPGLAPAPSAGPTGQVPPAGIPMGSPTGKRADLYRASGNQPEWLRASDAEVEAEWNRLRQNSGKAGGAGGGDWGSLWGALTNTNQQQFDWDKEKFNRDIAERIRQFDTTTGLSDRELVERARQFDKSLGLSDRELIERARQFDKTLGLSDRELLERARQYNESLGENRRQFNVGTDQWNRQFGEGQRQFNQNAYTNLSQGLLSGAASLRGPADWRKYAQYTGGGRDIFESIYGANPNPAFGAPAGYSPAISITDVLRQLGMLPGGQGGGQAQIQPYPDDMARVPRGTDGGLGAPVLAQPYPGGAPGDGMVSIPENDPNFRLESGNPMASALSQAITPVAGPPPSSAAGPQAPLPHQINPMVWDSLSNTAKQMILASAEAGDTSSGAWDPTDYLNQFEASRPKGQAPRRSQFNWSQGQSLF